MSGHTVSKGSTYRNWKSKLEHPDCTKSTETRQHKRSWLLDETWKSFSGKNAMADEQGIIARDIRRDMAMGRFRKLWKLGGSQ